MKCQNCEEYTFDIYKFAYRSIRKCPKCNQMYEMRFPVGIGFIPVIVGLLVSIYFSLNQNYTFMVGLSIFILVYYIIDIILKIVLISKGSYTIEEMHREG